MALVGRGETLLNLFMVVGVGFAFANSVAAQSLSGKWFGSASPQGGVTCWVNERRSYGMYELNFIITRDGSIRRHREEGTWFHANGLYASVTQKINGAPTDPSDRRFRDVYRVVELTAMQFRYADIASGKEFVVERVADNFTLGDLCPKLP